MKNYQKLSNIGAILTLILTILNTFESIASKTLSYGAIGISVLISAGCVIWFLVTLVAKKPTMLHGISEKDLLKKYSKNTQRLALFTALISILSVILLRKH